MGVHKLVVEGHVSGGRGDPVFHNETILAFDPKYVSLFIQTDKPMYYPPQSGKKIKNMKCMATIFVVPKLFIVSFICVLK